MLLARRLAHTPSVRSRLDGPRQGRGGVARQPRGNDADGAWVQVSRSSERDAEALARRRVHAHPRDLQRSWADRSPGGCCHLVPVEFRRTALWIALPQPAGPQTWLALAFELSANASPAANHINVLGHSARCQLYLPVLCWSNLGKRTLHPGSSSGRCLLVRTP